MEEKVRMVINGQEGEFPVGMTVLEAVQREGIDIPTLCYHRALDPAGLCRLCIVEVSGSIRPAIRVSCIQEVKEGLIVETETERIRRNRSLLLELFLARARDSVEIIDLAAKYGVTSSRFETGVCDECVRCGLCVRVCREKIGAQALSFSGRGYDRHLSTPFDRLSDDCLGCGACAQVCPTHAIRMDDRGNQRKIYTWGQVFARFTLEPCDACGRPFAPQKYIDYIQKKNIARAGFQTSGKICPECERKEMAQKRSKIARRPLR